jgi:hypothetical protein
MESIQQSQSMEKPICKTKLHVGKKRTNFSHLFIFSCKKRAKINENIHRTMRHESLLLSRHILITLLGGLAGISSSIMFPLAAVAVTKPLDAVSNLVAFLAQFYTRSLHGVSHCTLINKAVSQPSVGQMRPIRIDIRRSIRGLYVSTKHKHLN